MNITPHIPDDCNWTTSWKPLSSLSKSFPRSFPTMLRRLKSALKITRFAIDDKGISLTIAGRYICSCTLLGNEWKRQCNCEAKGDFCLHQFLLVQEVDKLLKQKGLIQQETAQQKTARYQQEFQKVQRQQQKDLPRRPLPSRNNTTTETIASPWKLTVEAERHYSPSQAAVRFYRDSGGDRAILTLQQLYNLAAKAHNRRSSDTFPQQNEDDLKFLAWLFKEIKVNHIYRSQEKLFKLTRSRLDKWFEAWKQSPGRFYDRLTNEPILNFSEFQAFIQPEIIEQKVRLHCLVGAQLESAKPFNEFVDKFKDAQTIQLANGDIKFNCPIPMKTLLHCFKSKKVPVLPLDKTCGFLPELLQGHTELLCGEFIEHTGQAKASIEASLQDDQILLKQKIDLQSLRLKGKLIQVKKPAETKLFDQFAENIEMTRESADLYSLRASAKNIRHFLDFWSQLPQAGKLDATLKSLMAPSEVNSQVMVNKNPDGSYRSQVLWRMGNQKIDTADIRQLAGKGDGLIRLRSGHWLNVSVPQLHERISLLEEYGMDMQGASRLHSMNVAKLDKIQDTLPMDPSSRDVLNSIVQNLEDTAKAIRPPQVQAELRSYQSEGYNFLKTLTNNNCGALLADDMGLGKTLQALSCLSDNQGLALIVAPSSVLDNWKNEILKFTPQLEYKLIRGNAEKREQIYESLKNFKGLVITSYALLRNDLRELKKIQFESIVLDEAHFIKNPESQVSRAARQVKADKKIALSGTPLENSVDDLWTIMNFLNPGLLGTIDDFRFLCQSSESRVIVKRLNPFMLRRTKKMAAPELPPKTFIPLNVEMSETQNRIYKNEIVRAKKAVQDKSTMSILASLTRLRQIASHSSFGCPEGEGPDPSLPLSERSPKAAALIEKSKDLIAEGHSSLVFSQFTGILGALEDEMAKEGIKTYKITGETPVAKRAAIVDAFMNDPEPSVFLLSLKAAGTGLNLTRASYVFIFDPWWNPAAENQAIDRSHRIGQENPVIIYRLIASQSVEEKVVAMQEEKRQLFADLVDQEEFTSSKSFNRNELINLFDFN